MQLLWSLCPAVMPYQSAVRAFVEEVRALFVALSGEAAVRGADDTAVGIVELAVLIAALWRDVVNRLSLVVVLVDRLGRVAHRIALVFSDELIDPGGVRRLWWGGMRARAY